MKYSAGDKVTFVLGDQDAVNLNRKESAIVKYCQVVAHEPKPQPILIYRARDYGDSQWVYSESRLSLLPVIEKITIDQETMKATIEQIS